MWRSFLCSVVLALLLAACGGQPTTLPPAEGASPQPQPSESSTLPEAPPDEPPDEPDVSAWLSQSQPLPAAPQEVEIPTSDGRTLAGFYFPAKVNPAPIVVLMHWAGGDMRDWAAMAPWLQNRPDELADSDVLSGAQIDGPWLDPTWFPPLVAEASFGVLVFDYSGFGQSAFSSSADALLQDSLAAMMFASTLKGADPNMLLSAGASIGADGTVDGCYLFNQAVAAGEAEGLCLAALSLSPGNYLASEFTYMQAVAELSQAEHRVFCLAAEGDVQSADVCVQSEAAFSTPFLYPGDAHGMSLVDPTMHPSAPAVEANALQLLLDLFAMATGWPVAN